MGFEFDLPSWSPARKNQIAPSSPYDFEAIDAESIGGERHAASGATPYAKLDSSNADFLTDNKLTKRASYSINREFWRKRQQMARDKSKSFRESVLFIDDSVVEGHSQRELHLVVIEGHIFKQLQNDSLELRKLLETND